MRINFLLPFIMKTGGIAVIVQHAKGLRALGHDVALYHPLLPYRHFLAEERSPFRKYVLGQLKPLVGNCIRSYRNDRTIPWTVPPERAIPVPVLANAFLRDADVSIATAWPTAHSLAGLSPSKGRKFYFVQHYEAWDSDVSQVDASYRLPMEILTIAPWLTDLMRTKFGREVKAEIHNGIDLERFSPPPARDWNRPAILMLHHEVEWKGIRDGLEVLEAIHARYPDVPIRMFGLHPFPDKPPWVEFHRDPAPDRLVDLYRSSTVFLSPSHREGWHLPPMEAMACGCAVVATTVGCIPTLDDGSNMLVSAPRDTDALFRHLEALFSDPALCRRIGGNGRKTIESYSWEKSTRSMEDALLPRPA